MTRRAFVAIVRSRLVAERRTLVVACGLALLVGFIQPDGVTGPLFFCSALGITISLLQGPGRADYLDACERGAPFFGRELARAKSVAPLIATTLTLLCYVVAQIPSASALSPIQFVVALACIFTATLVALNATLREGAARLLYIGLACATVGAAYALALRVNPAAELVFCFVCGFIALRQYGEALARFEPIGY
jgi:hypothetical protein